MKTKQIKSICDRCGDSIHHFPHEDPSKFTFDDSISCANCLTIDEIRAMANHVNIQYRLSLN